MTSQVKKFVVMIKLTTVIVSTKNIILSPFLVSSLEFFKQGYPAQNVKLGVQNDS